MADLAKLVVKLEAQTAQYQAQMERATSQLEKFKATTVGVAAGVGAALGDLAVRAGSAFVSMAKSAIDSADNLSKLSQSTGASTEFLSEVAYAADLSGASLEDLTSAFSRLGRAASEAQQGSAAQVDAFNTLGVSVVDAAGKLKSSETLLEDVSEAFAGIQDGAAKSALAQEIFGKSGAKLIPFLNLGKQGLAELRAEAQALGITLSTEAGKEAEAFNDNLTRVASASRGLVNQFVQAALPTLKAISERFVEASKDGGALSLAVRVLSGTFKTLVSAGIVVTSVFQQLGLIINGVGEAIFFAVQGKFSEAMNALKERARQARDNVFDDATSIGKIWTQQTEVVATAATKVGRVITRVNADTKKAQDEAAKAAKSALDQLQKLAGGIQQQIATFGQGEVATLQYRIAQGDLADVFAKAGPAGQVYKEELISLTQQLQMLEEKSRSAQAVQERELAIMTEAARIYEATRTPLEAYTKEVERLALLLETGYLSQESFARAVAKAAEGLDKVDEPLKNAASGFESIISNAMTNGFEDGARGILSQFVNLLVQLQAKALAAKLVDSLLGAIGSGGGGVFGAALGAIAGGTRSTGGDVRAGRSYLVGERGAEKFVPDVNGTVIANDQMKANVTVNPQINNILTARDIAGALNGPEGEQMFNNFVVRNKSVLRNVLQGA